MQQRLSIITLGVKDLQVANDFYLNTFGWRKLESSNENITFMQLNGILLSLYPKDKLADDAGVEDQEKGMSSMSLAYVTRTKDEVDQLFSDLKLKGVKVIKEPEEAFWGGYSGYIADPDQNLWEIAYNPFLELDDEGNVR